MPLPPPPRRLDEMLPLSPHQFHILLALMDRDLHGYGIILDVAARTGGALRLGTGTLYTAIARLVELGLIADTGRADDRRRYYRLTPAGRVVLRAETVRLETLVQHAHARGLRPTVRLPGRARS
ncbi:MAG TPA: helix-turn-helix transcriptional regulator [Vicinamibacterales bacterium]|nr:helix-turn-helix transcriptional regulator [Vicinamibacterales bacterium]